MTKQIEYHRVLRRGLVGASAGARAICLLLVERSSSGTMISTPFERLLRIASRASNAKNRRMTRHIEGSGWSPISPGQRPRPHVRHPRAVCGDAAERLPTPRREELHPNRVDAPQW